MLGCCRRAASGPVQTQLPRLVDDAHAATAQLFEQLVAGDRRERGRCLAALAAEAVCWIGFLVAGGAVLAELFAALRIGQVRGRRRFGARGQMSQPVQKRRSRPADLLSQALSKAGPLFHGRVAAELVEALLAADTAGYMLLQHLAGGAVQRLRQELGKLFLGGTSLHGRIPWPLLLCRPNALARLAHADPPPPGLPL